MLQELSFFTVSSVTDSWQVVRKIENYKEVVGVRLYRKFFELEPKAVSIFSFGKNVEINEDFYSSPGLRRHAKLYVTALDRAIALLGPEMDLLVELVLDLGYKHHQFGVRASYYPAMGIALLKTLEEVLGELGEFTPEVKLGWLQIFQALSVDMVGAAHSKTVAHHEDHKSETKPHVRKHKPIKKTSCHQDKENQAKRRWASGLENILHTAHHKH